MATKSKKTSARRAVSKASTKAARLMITNDHVIKVLKKDPGFENKETGLYKNAMAVINSNGKTVAEAKKKAKVDSWTVRDLVNKKVITVTKVA
jgi:hypothetical protein